MKKIAAIGFILLSIIHHSFAQKLQWFPFEWHGSEMSGKYYDRFSINIPVTIDDLPHKFNMQFDLGATNTMLYGNSIAPYLEKYKSLKNKIDTTLTFMAEGEKNFKFRRVNLKLGMVDIGAINIGHFKNFGDSISVDSMNTASEKHIGTLGANLFQGKILIIDYPNKRICISKEIPKQFKKASYQPFKIDKGRIKIPLKINGQEEDLMFDTGASLFALLTSKERAKAISNGDVVDSLEVTTWGKYYTVLGEKLNPPIYFGNTQLKKVPVHYHKADIFKNFFMNDKIWGLTGNAFFLDNVVIIDYQKQLFGVK